ncbi:MAG: rRNA maturation RNase YbeY [Betaproteobacteria bacterium]|nr:rRNA maturation RNase YbeY [Betaproteobacteria bacterium]MDE1982152.1 rRNA maturation RNase YbeY [Betaproteobacteria bacterium]MDE2132869.1 rRNA maturation RNase YbeY [Betaproteobacteria bacterium]MDE2212367.1 rRNA maturation RNase YbeY [Betaproteobacteria bacterium]MDE2625223.1 rRNA maturation RNase YbeY [Betaproteobacteria bacterium]
MTMDPEPQPSLALSVQRASRTTGQPSTPQLRRWSNAALQGPATVTIRLVDRREGQRLNRDYRHKDYPTNVLTFAYGREQDTWQGDLVLCAPVVKAEARAQKKPLAHHYAHLVVHGLLHLQGYDHERARDAAAMEALEIEILERLSIPNPYLPAH